MFKINYDRIIRISSAGSRKSTSWPASETLWSEFAEKLKTPVRSTESLAEYIKMKKAEQDDLKDVGGFVGGTFKGDRRKANLVSGRDILTLDMDNIPPGGTEDILRRVEGLGCGYCLYSTRKHSRSAPRLRVLIPFDRTVSADEYEPLARKLASIAGIEFCDPTTFEASRLMYWPSVCRDSEYVYSISDKPFLSADGLLAMYSDWRDVRSWPQVPGQNDAGLRLAKKQTDPTLKSGVVGAFCKTFDIYRAMDEIIPGVYSACDTADRYTYSEGSTSGGAIVYQDGKFLYSHHATDPCGGKLVNAFDMVRLHKFGGLDDQAKPDTPANKLPSYTAMCKFAVSDAGVGALINAERYEQTARAFGGEPDETLNWISLLRLSATTGTPNREPYNVAVMLENDPALKGRIWKDLFADRVFAQAPVPWGNRLKETEIFGWTDADDAGLRMYTQEILKFSAKDVVEMAFKNHTAKNGINPVTDYLNGLKWDGIKRLERLFIEYLGAADTDYTRAITRKSFTAAVARAMSPGIKFDAMVILTGAQGIGKSSLLKKMGKTWFSDSIKTFEGKEASELVQGVWIVEIGELEAFNRSEVGRIKQFLSQQEDIYRPAYGRHVEWHPRRCVFFGTSNNSEYLRDSTGARRFWPLDVGVVNPVKSVFSDLDEEIDQLWAEAVVYYRLGESLYLTGEIERAAKTEQEGHRETNAREGVILDYLEKEVPENWNKMPLDERRIFLSGGGRDGVSLVKKDRICALEVWCEALGGDVKSMKRSDAAEINAVISSAEGWEKQKSSLRFGYAGVQKGFINVDNNHENIRNFKL